MGITAGQRALGTGKRVSPLRVTQAASETAGHSVRSSGCWRAWWLCGLLLGTVFSSERLRDAAAGPGRESSPPRTSCPLPGAGTPWAPPPDPPAASVLLQAVTAHLNPRKCHRVSPCPRGQTFGVRGRSRLSVLAPPAATREPERSDLAGRRPRPLLARCAPGTWRALSASARGPSTGVRKDRGGKCKGRPKASVTEISETPCGTLLTLKLTQLTHKKQNTDISNKDGTQPGT